MDDDWGYPYDSLNLDIVWTCLAMALVRSSGITYSASNAYLDGLSLWRRQENLPCSSLQPLGHQGG